MTLPKMVVLFTLTALVPAAVLAGPIPYANPGTPLAAGTDLFAGGGPVRAYFYGSSAAFLSELFLDLPGMAGPALPNHTSTPGQMVDLGSFPHGTPLRFRLYVNQLDGTFRNLYTGSAPDPEGDTEVHAYVTPWPGGPIPGSSVVVPGPAFFVGFEDIHGSASDWDYNDHQFVFTSVATHTPEPSTLVLIGGAGLVLGLWRRKRQARSARS